MNNEFRGNSQQLEKFKGIYGIAAKVIRKKDVDDNDVQN